MYCDSMSETQSVVVTIGERREEGGEPLAREIRSMDGRPVSMPSTPAMAVVHGVAAVLETDPHALDPLAETVDPDALNRLVQSWMEGGEETASATFGYCGCSVTVYGSGEILIDRHGRFGNEETRGTVENKSAER